MTVAEMQASRRHHRRQVVPSVHQNLAHRPRHSHQLVPQRHHRPMPALLPDRDSRSLSRASRHVVGKRKGVPSGSGHCTEVRYIVS